MFEWLVVGALVVGSAFYSVWRLLPRQRRSAGGAVRPSAAGCHSCAHGAAPLSPTQKTGALRR